MANFWKQILSSHRNFLQNYRNVTKLKVKSYSTISQNTGSNGIPRFLPLSTPLTFMKPENIIPNLNSINMCCMSRWTRYSASGLFGNNSSRKKHRREVLAERLRARILSAKIETRKKVHKKMTEIVGFLFQDLILLYI